MCPTACSGFTLCSLMRRGPEHPTMGIPPVVGHADGCCDLIKCQKAADCECDVMLGIISLHLLGAGNLLAPQSSSTAGWGCKCKCTCFHQQLLVDVQEPLGIEQRETRGGNRRGKSAGSYPRTSNLNVRRVKRGTQLTTSPPTFSPGVGASI